MFKRKTVFILGAGASWHYGFPTGDGLVKTIAQACSQVSNFFALCMAQKPLQIYPKIVLPAPLAPCEDPRRPWREHHDAFVDFIRRLGSIFVLFVIVPITCSEGLHGGRGAE
jgi:hypothetical protein